jgi:transglutaminase-like putative cysteine protease
MDEWDRPIRGNVRSVETMARRETLTMHVGCQFEYSSNEPTPAICIVRPSGFDGIRIVSESWLTTPTVPYHDYVDIYGNVCRRLTLPAGLATIWYDAHVECPNMPEAIGPNVPQTPVQDLPDDVLVYTLPSRFCLSDGLIDRAWGLFGNGPTGWQRAQAISQFVHDHVTFGYQYTTPTTTSSDVLENAQGVCRDFTHLGIALCRAMSIPARYVFGYIPDVTPQAAPMDFCAWMEVFLDGRWWTFDPRNNEQRLGRVIIARGRDAADVPMMTTYGAAFFQKMTVWAELTGG